MYMFDLNWQPILWAIVVPIQIKDVLYQQAIHQKYDRNGDETPSGPFRPHIYLPDIIMLFSHGFPNISPNMFI